MRTYLTSIYIILFILTTNVLKAQSGLEIPIEDFIGMEKSEIKKAIKSFAKSINCKVKIESDQIRLETPGNMWTSDTHLVFRLDENTGKCHTIQFYETSPREFLFPESYWREDSKTKGEYRLRTNSIPDLQVTYIEGSKINFLVPIKESVVLREFSTDPRYIEYLIYDVMECQWCFVAQMGTNEEREAYKNLINNGTTQIDEYVAPAYFSVKNITAENCIKGDCLAEYAQEAEIDVDGLRYIGEMRNGAANGKGKIVDMEGRDILVSGWKDGLPNGTYEFTTYSENGYVALKENGRMYLGKPEGIVHFDYQLDGFRGTWDMEPVKDYLLQLSAEEKEGYAYPGFIKLEIYGMGLEPWEYEGTGFLHPLCLHSLYTTAEGYYASGEWVNGRTKKYVSSTFTDGKPNSNSKNLEVPIICVEKY